jgi:superfamily II DNA or RNA helicase
MASRGAACAAALEERVAGGLGASCSGGGLCAAAPRAPRRAPPPAAAAAAAAASRLRASRAAWSGAAPPPRARATLRRTPAPPPRAAARPRSPSAGAAAATPAAADAPPSAATSAPPLPPPDAPDGAPPPARRVRKMVRSKPVAPSYGDASTGAVWSAALHDARTAAARGVGAAAPLDAADNLEWQASGGGGSGQDTMRDRMRIAAAVGAAADAADAAAAADDAADAAAAKAAKAAAGRVRRAGVVAASRAAAAAGGGAAGKLAAASAAGGAAASALAASASPFSASAPHAPPGGAAAAVLRALPSGVSLADVLRAKFRERRERSLSRVRAQLRSREEDGSDDPSAPLAGASTALGGSSGAGGASASSGLSNAIDWRTLTAGEYVVHKTYGVGKYLGARKVAPRPDAPPEDYLFIKYADATAKLRASAAARLVYRYRMPGETRGKAVRLCSLHDPTTWQRRQAKGRLAIAKLVNTLMDVYLERVMVTRPSYADVAAADAATFAGGFAYPLTADQTAAVEDIYADMSRDTPMDRLVIGDVGFGKTEVAMRAVLRAVAAGKQVLVLTPTTVLARQHAGLFASRFAPLGIPTGFLTRFTSPAERRGLTAAMAAGTMQVVVGTHALLAEAELCPNLGLLVVDEEQRFGVRHKERITSLHTAIDVLTMSATPIPRTLHMALAGFRDTSVIATPPPGRRPIDTTLTPFDEALVVRAIQAELARGGQVFYIVPRIEAMDAKVERLRRLLPGLGVQSAHGRMGAGELEETMEAFSQATFDVLVCTTIVESGLDLPRVNTIIIEDVHMFGLASLYQLRGRVGRNDLQAYAYLLWEPTRELSEEASARLAAISDCCGLGEGFRLAERDMAIRGVGAVFGDKQSGDVANVGVDLYLEMLYEQLAGVEGQRLPSVAWDAVDVRIPLRGAVPPSIVGSEADARQLAARAADAGRAGPASLKALAAEIERSTGALLPKPLHALLRGHLLRWYASELGVHAIHAATPGIVMLETDMSESAFFCIEGLLAEPERAALRWQPGGVAVRVSVAAPDVHAWALQPDMHAERAIAALAGMHAAAPKFLKYV